MAANTRHYLLVSLKEAQGNWVSGEELSRKLGITRTAIWKQACSLRNEGYIIDSSTRKGYLLREALDRLLPAEIEASLRSKRLGHRIVFEKEVDSTNRLARDLAIAGAVEGTLVVAESQTGGRGRRGRNWFSPPGEGIYLSLVLRPRFQPAEAPKMTLLAGVALAETLIPIVPSRVTAGQRFPLQVQPKPFGLLLKVEILSREGSAQSCLAALARSDQRHSRI